MEARVRKAGCDAGELHRRAQEGLAQRRAVLRVVVFARRPRRAREKRAASRPRFSNSAATIAPAADRFAVDVPHLVDDGEAVAAPQIVIEIDVAGKDVGHLQRHGVRKTRRVGGGEQRRADFADGHLPPNVHRRRLRSRRRAASPSRAIDNRWPSPVMKRRFMSRPSSSVSTVSGLPGPELVQGPRRRIGAQEFEGLRGRRRRGGRARCRWCRRAARGLRASSRPRSSSTTETTGCGMSSANHSRSGASSGAVFATRPKAAAQETRTAPTASHCPGRRRWPRPPRGGAGALG